MRVVAGLVVILLAAVALRAQSESIGAQEKERARELLGSPHWVEKAWGAYLAARLHSPDLQQALVDEFRTAAALRDSPSWTDEHAFVYVLFDAAIEAGIRVAADLLEPFEQNWTDPVIILLARGSDGEDALLRMSGEKSPNLVWLAANNLLLERKSQAWYARTLGEVTITHRFTVTDLEFGPGVGGGTGGGVYRDGVAAMPKGFPPVVLYTLEDFPQRGSILVARGPRNIYCKRTVVPTDQQVGIGSSESYLDRMPIRLEYLAEAAHVDAIRATELFHPETAIQYRGTEDFERQAQQNMTTQQQGIDRLLQCAKERGFSAAGVRLRIIPDVVDQRKDKTDPLPAVAEREIVFN